MARDGSTAGTLKHLKKGAFDGEGGTSFAMRDRAEQFARARIVRARLNRDNALPDCGNEIVQRKDFCSGVSKIKTLQTRERQHGGVHHTFVEFAQTGLHIAAKRHDLDVGPSRLTSACRRSDAVPIRAPAL